MSYKMFCFAKCCRLCLARGTDLFNYSIKDNNNISYYDKIVELIPNLLSFSSKKLPELLCTKCKDHLDTSYVFKQNCLKSQELLLIYNYQLNTDSVNNTSLTNYDVNVNAVNVNELINDENQSVFQNNVIQTCDNEELVLNHSLQSESYKIDLYIKSEENVEFVNSIEVIHSEPQVNDSENIFEKNPKNLDVIHIVRNVKLENDVTNPNTIDLELSNFNPSIENIKCEPDSDNDVVLTEENNELPAEEEEEEAETHLISVAASETVELPPNGNQENSVNTEEVYNNRLRKKIFPCKKFDEGKPYTCEICNRKFTKLNYLHLHQRVHNNVNLNPAFLTRKIHNIKICKKVISQRKFIGKKPYVCKICNRKFGKINYLRLHQRVHNVPNLLQCEKCLKQFKFSDDLEQHKQTHIDGKQDVCDKDDKKFTALEQLIVPKRKYATKTLYPCGICNKKFVAKCYVKKHQIIHTGIKPFECKICGKKFNQSNNLNRHIDLLHKKLRPFKCDKCHSFFGTQQHLNRHGNQFHNVKENKMRDCEICGRQFYKEKHLIKHIRSTHRTGKLFNCKTCDKKFLLKTQLEKHENIHAMVTSDSSLTSENNANLKKKFTCKVCNRNFSQSNYLTLHERCHIVEKPFQCETCGKRFSCMLYWKTHQRAHTCNGSLRLESNQNLKKNLTCKVCKRTFSQSNYLAFHERCHREGKPFKCEVCGKRYLRMVYLKMHQRVHIYNCEFCNKQFSEVCHLANHNCVPGQSNEKICLENIEVENTQQLANDTTNEESQNPSEY